MYIASLVEYICQQFVLVKSLIIIMLLLIYHRQWIVFIIIVIITWVVGSTLSKSLRHR